jgi:hypothetical protein
MANRLKRLVAVAALVMGFAGSTVAITAAPASAAGSCNGAGWLCFYDYGSATYGNVAGDNYAWGAFGWNDRADWFYNQGNYCSVRVYRDNGGGGGGYLIPRGSTLTWYNTVSSNYWC